MFESEAEFPYMSNVTKGSFALGNNCEENESADIKKEAYRNKRYESDVFY